MMRIFLVTGDDISSTSDLLVHADKINVEIANILNKYLYLNMPTIISLKM